MITLRFFKQTKENKIRVAELETNIKALESKIKNLEESKWELENTNTSFRKTIEKSKKVVGLLESQVTTLNEKLQKSQRKETENNNLFRKIQSFLQMTTKELREFNKEFPVMFDEAEEGWTLTTAICSLGGCEYEYETYKSEREALINANIKQERGLKVNMGCACRPCYREYLAECE